MLICRLRVEVQNVIHLQVVQVAYLIEKQNAREAKLFKGTPNEILIIESTRRKKLFDIDMVWVIRISVCNLTNQKQVLIVELQLI